MTILLVVLFVIAIVGSWYAIFHEEDETYSDFLVWRFPDGSSFEYQTSSREGILRGGYPGDWITWDRANGGYIRHFNGPPKWIDLDQNGDLVRYELGTDGKSKEIYRDSFF